MLGGGKLLGVKWGSPLRDSWIGYPRPADAVVRHEAETEDEAEAGAEAGVEAGTEAEAEAEAETEAEAEATQDN